MKILFISHYFPPEIGPGQTRVYEYARSLVKKGHEVTVLTPCPNYPSGIIPAEYRGRVFMREKKDGINIIRTYVFATPNKGFFRRIINHLSFTVSAMLGALFTKKGYEIVNVISPPLFLGVTGYMVSLMNKAKFIFEVRDPWPDVAIILGVLKNRFLIKLSLLLEKFIYKKSDLITTASSSLLKVIREKGIPYEKLSTMPAGVDVNFFRPGLETNHFREQHGLTNKFLVMYAGNHGLSHNLETILNAANLLKGKKDIKFVLIGDGVEKKDLIHLAEDKNISNVLFLPPVERKMINITLNTADVCVASLKSGDYFKSILSIKVFEYMACGKPVVASIKGETGDFLNKSGGGICVEPEDAKAMAEAILHLFKNEDVRKEMGVNGRTGVVDFYSRQRFIDRMESNFTDLLHSGRINPANIDIDISPLNQSDNE